MNLLAKRKHRDWDDAVCRVAFDKNVDAILVLSEKEIVACNDAAVRALRCSSKAEILSRSPSELAPELQPDGRRSADVAKEQIAAALHGGHARFEWLHRRFDGSTFSGPDNARPDPDKWPIP
jgi:PAS domain-containing protein